MRDVLLIDSDVLIEYLRGRAAASNYLESLETRAAVSVITVAELYSGTRNEKEVAALDLFLGAFDIVSIDQKIARLGGQFRNQYKGTHGTGIADALIAATACVINAKLVTFNIKHYPMLTDLAVPYQRT